MPFVVQKYFFLNYLKERDWSCLYFTWKSSWDPKFISLNRFNLHSHSLALDIEAHYLEYFEVLLGKQASQVSIPLNIPDGLSPGYLSEAYWWEAVIRIGCDHKAGGNPWNAYCCWFEKYYSTEHICAPAPEAAITGHRIIMFATLWL